MIKKTEKTVRLDEIKVNEHNPRQIKQKEMDKLKKSLKDFPEMMQLRPIVVDEDGVILGGNMRYQALVASGADSADVIQVEGLTEDQKREFIIKDNVPYGDWDWDALANEWDPDELNDWGLANIKTGLADEKNIEEEPPTIVSSFITFDYSDEVQVRISDETAAKLMSEMITYRDEHGNYDGFWDERLKR